VGGGGLASRFHPGVALPETYGGKDYPAWLVENSCEEAAFEDLEEEEEEGGAEAYVVVVCPRGECCAVAPAAGGGDRCPSCRTPFSPFKLSGPQVCRPLYPGLPQSGFARGKGYWGGGGRSARSF